MPYPAFKYDGRRWFGHRWAAKFIHGQDIEHFQTDHCCPHIPIPNTLCVEHVQSLTAERNLAMQHIRRKAAIHLQVGLLQYSDLYGHDPEPLLVTGIPFFDPPAWLGNQGTSDADCPF